MTAKHHHSEDDETGYIDMLERSNRFQEPEVRAAIGALQLPEASRGLDVGCGVGLFSLWLADAIGPQGRVLGIDQSKGCVEAALERARAGLEFRRGEGIALDEPDQSFDWVWCSDVLHHIDEPVAALREFARVLLPGGRIIIKESQVLQGVYLPGHPELERKLQSADVSYHRHDAGSRSFQERRQRTLGSILEAGLPRAAVRTYLIERQAPLDEITRAFIKHVVFERNWGGRIREFLDPQDWQARSALCESGPDYILSRRDYYCILPITFFTTRLSPAEPGTL
jgi:demethylmenaquinone methyltransferase/2-methoxy-6-polyprenyl-1,4-benzoquinol methylase